ncbi:MAG: ABC transporter substrate-binding protein [Alphaproteobacteria bacterium]|nr:ABC transporter substrate-binding protein [Alphaproteobacteria bacterium]
MRKILIVGCLLVLGLLGAGPARAAPGSASDVVQHFYVALLDAMKNGPQLGAKGRYEKLAPVVLASFDVPFMTRMAVGLSWGHLTPEEKQRAWKAFARYITATYASQFAKYDGERFEVQGEEKVKHGTVVRTRIVPSDGDTVAINYVLHDNDTAWQIRDVYLTGTISELATRRSEFTGILRNGGIEGLIAQLNKKADDLIG